jgi:hypothetical protein
MAALDIYDTPLKDELPFKKMELPIDLSTLGCACSLTADPDMPGQDSRTIKIWKSMTAAKNVNNALLNIQYGTNWNPNPYVQPVLPNFVSVTVANEVISSNFYIGEYNDINECPSVDKYRIVKALPVNSSYGRMFIIRDGNDVEYVLKVCKAKTDIDKHNVISEFLIQHIIYETTKNNNHYDCPYTMKIHKAFKLNFKDYWEWNHPYVHPPQESCLGIIMEYANPWMSIGTRMKATALHDEYDRIRVIVKICRMLKNLQEAYNFAHGDLHTGNAYYRDNVVKLIDFGRSALTISGIELKSLNEDFSAKNRKHFDMLYLVAAMYVDNLVNRLSKITKQIITDPVLNRIKQYNNLHIHAGVVSYVEYDAPTNVPSALPKKVIDNYYDGKFHTAGAKPNRAIPDQIIANRNDWCYPAAPPAAAVVNPQARIAELEGIVAQKEAEIVALQARPENCDEFKARIDEKNAEIVGLRERPENCDEFQARINEKNAEIVGLRERPENCDEFQARLSELESIIAQKNSEIKALTDEFEQTFLTPMGSENSHASESLSPVSSENSHASERLAPVSSKNSLNIQNFRPLPETGKGGSRILKSLYKLQKRGQRKTQRKKLRKQKSRKNQRK